MKKIMTLFASAASLCAFSAAQAETLTYTGFETAAVNPAYVAGQALSTTNDDMNRTSDDMDFEKTWCPIELDDGEAVVTAYDDNTMRAATNVSTFTSTDLLSNYLKLDTGDKQVARCAQTGGEGYEIPSAGVYVDTLVKFTVSEDTPDQTTEDGDKLCIWVNVDSETGATNLMVKAGYIEDDQGFTVPTNYVVTGAFPNGDAEGWHRLTILAYSDIDTDGWLASGFAIKIDGNLVGTDICPFADASTYTFNDNVAAYMASSPYKLFPSLVSLTDDDGSGNSMTITSIGFKGSGSIDNVQFTETDPIPPAPGPTPSTYELTITATGDATNTVWTATTNGISVASEDFIEDGQAVVVVVTPNTGWEYATTPADWSEGTAGAITRTFTVSGAALAIEIPAPTAKSSGYDSGDGEHTFEIATAKKAALEAALSTLSKTLTDTVPGSSTLTYAQAYALGLWDENDTDVAPLDATISVGADGKVTVTLANQPAEGYVVTCYIYEKANLTAEWPSTPATNYAYGSETAFTPGSATAGFYKVAIVITNQQ